MFLTKNFTPIVVLFCSLLAIRVLPSPLVNDVDEDDVDEDDVEVTDIQKSEDENQEQAITVAVKKNKKWLKNIKTRNVMVFYLIDNDSAAYTDTHLAMIREGMDQIEKYTCVRFVKRTNQSDYIRIYSGNTCSSKIGKIGGMQDVSLNCNGCMIRKKIVHELIHALGFTHMHKRFDRDDYVTIHWKNMDPSHEHAFTKLNNQYEAFNTTYDLLSCMHYPKDFFSVNGGDTIVPKDKSYIDKIGNVTTLSEGDALRINRMYQCGI